MSGPVGADPTRSRAAAAVGAARAMMTATPRCAGAVVAVLGPTGVGKTAVATELALLFRTGIISCDSMQLYQGFPVLTNQPSAEERGAVRHELVGVIDPRETCTAAEYAAMARQFIERDLAKTGRALVVGGTGLYMRAALAPLAVQANADPGLRAALEERARLEGPAALHAELTRLDPVAAAGIDARNVRRVIRAIEAISTTGRSWSGRTDLWTPSYSYPTVMVGLTLDRERLYRRIDRRAARIVEGGAVEEVRRFRDEYGEEATRPGGPGIRSAIGYPEICRYLEGEQSLAGTVDLIAAATRRYARRQLTWLRKVEGAVIIDVGDRDPRETAGAIASLTASRESALAELGPL